MDDFLGTSIQYSEYQIKLLEREHYENQQKIVEDLINSGFLDSDYEDTTETETETESTDNELSVSEASLEVKENNDYLNSNSESETIDDSKMNISPKSMENSLSESTSIEQSPSPSSINNKSNDNLAKDLGSDISVVDESNVSNSESIDDASINNQIIHSQQIQYSDNHNIDNDNEYKVQEYEHENEYDSDDQIQEIQQFDIVTSKAIIRFMEIIFSDIKYLMILFILMIAMPHIIDRAHQNDDMYGSVKYPSNNGYPEQHEGCHQNQGYWQTEIYWELDRATTTHSIINDEDDERDEYQNDDGEGDEDGDVTQCVNKQHILKFDIISTKLDKETKELRGHLSHHEIKIPTSDLLSCHANKNINNMNFLRMRLKNMPIPTEMAGLFMKIGAGLKGQQLMGAGKYTSIATHLTRSHGIHALVMAFVGIAGFAASNGIDEIITISS
eukprot:CAMPEP_0201567384 /NCGR_PEP_ID=MMETSP0190_2-20130828/7876_1 /ASSEMBLY_ACC=CAM_ASM_000263 /TAXON_ID=37353 /ORGANISM="Rosalina sp." /LENGTH=443 /DNA_ID=CAMNT_0047987323 /DNA_START=121 /DNA_END=1452 /DNA_ORIENTATION=-